MGAEPGWHEESGAGPPAAGPLAFRTAAAADVTAVVRLVEAAYRGESSRAGWTTEADLLEGRRTDTDAIAAVVADPHAELVLGERGATGAGAQLLACCELSWLDDRAYFGTFAVSPTAQGGGIGSQVLAEAERRTRARGLAVLEMKVVMQRADLIGWYLRRGYTRTGESRPFPYGDERFGRPLRDDLAFDVLAKAL